MRNAFAQRGTTLTSIAKCAAALRHRRGLFIDRDARRRTTGSTGRFVSTCCTRNRIRVDTREDAIAVSTRRDLSATSKSRRDARGRTTAVGPARRRRVDRVKYFRKHSPPVANARKRGVSCIVHRANSINRSWRRRDGGKNTFLGVWRRQRF